MQPLSVCSEVRVRCCYDMREVQIICDETQLCSMLVSTKMPLNLDGYQWLFRKASHATSDMTILMTPMSGKVFEIQEKLKQQKENKKKSKDPMKLLADDTSKTKRAPKAKAAGKAKAKAKAKGKAFEEVENDEGKTECEVMLNGAHGVLTRDKYFVDCLVMCVRSAIRSARARLGASTGDLPADTESGQLIYDQMELSILHECVRYGLAFCHTKEFFLKRSHKKWSSMRPVLQTHAIQLWQKASVTCVLCVSTYIGHVAL